MTLIARGTFEVSMHPQSPHEPADGATLGRMALDKVFHGELEGVGKGEMLTAVTDTAGSAGYVAIERVTGTLHGQSGSFVLQHSGTMHAGTQRLEIGVVPDSATGALRGLAGRLLIKIAEGQHFYEFEYTLGAPAGS